MNLTVTIMIKYFDIPNVLFISFIYPIMHAHFGEEQIRVYTPQNNLRTTLLFLFAGCKKNRHLKFEVLIG